MMKGRLTATLGLAVLLGGTVSLRAFSSEAIASIPAQALPTPLQPVAHIQKLAFGVGEKMVFRFGWNDIPAAEMAMVVKEVEAGGRRFFQYIGAAKTLPHVEWLYPLSDQVEAVLDAESLEPVRYSLMQNEKGRQTATVVQSDGKHFTGYRRAANSKEYAVKVTREHDYDPVTVAYLARSLPLAVGKSYSFRVFDGRYQYLFTLSVDRREEIQIKSGKYKAFRITPTVINLSKPDNPKKIKRATLWVSDDERRVPLRVESEVFFGKVYGELVAYSNGG
jgi:hypothetical protein